MAGSGAPALTVPPTQARIAIVASSWHERVMDGLIEGARRALTQAGSDIRVLRVPGSFELPLGAAYAFEAGAEAVVALGVVIRGGTPHFEYVCEAATHGLSELALKARKPVGFGVLTCDNEQQALARAGLSDSVEDKGYEAAVAALQMLALARQR